MAGLRLFYKDGQNEEPERNQDSTYIYEGPEVGVPKGIKLAKIGPDVKEIRKEAFVPTLISYGWGGPFYEESNLTHVDFTHANHLETIGESAFAYCKSLTTATLAPSIRVIERFAFRACGLKHIDLTEAKNLERIGAEAFSDSCSLETVQFSPNIHVIERALFAGCRELREVQIYEHVVEIAEKAFMDTPKLESFDFAKATSLHRNGYQAFSGCKALTIAHFGPMVKTIGDEAFIHHRLRVVIFNELLETIGSRAFSCKYGHGNVFSEELLENVDFSRAQNLYRIGKQAFGCCISLTNIKLAKNIKILESKAFENCYRLKEIEMNSKLERIGDAAFAACHHLETVALPPGVKHIPANAFCDCSSLQRVVLPNSCESLGDAAFAFCNKEVSSQAEHLRVGPDVKEIPSYLFGRSRRNSLESVTFHDKLEKLSVDAFTRCPNLNNVSIPSSVTHCGLAFNTKFLDSMDIQGTDPNLPLAIRLSVLYPNATPSITMDHSVFLYSFRRIQRCDLLEPRYSSGFAKQREHQSWKNLCSYILRLFGVWLCGVLKEVSCNEVRPS